MIRKDSDLITTIDKIKGKLEELGIHTYISSFNSCMDLWYSIRVEIEGIPDCGTNGKGLTYDAALASAYGEFMERLESGFLLGKFFPSKNGYDYEKNNSNYYDVFNREKVVLSEAEVDVSCGTNGLSAGNSYYECFVQGSCEVFERYILKKIYADDTNMHDLFKIVSEEQLEAYDIYKQIVAIREKGYEVSVIDCTLGGIIPVLGVLVENRKFGKYYFALGSDFSIDICLARCITEIFQGKNFNISFRHEMLSCFDVLEDDEKSTQFVKSFMSNEGKLPAFLLNLSKEKRRLGTPFVCQEISNKELVHYVMDVYKKLGVSIYIKDYSWLGFPCIRIYVPGMSNILDDKTNGVNERISFSKYLHKAICKTDRDYAELCMMIKENIDNLYGLSGLLGIKINDTERENVWIADAYIFFATVAYLARDYSLAIQCYKLSSEINQYELYALKLMEKKYRFDADEIDNKYLLFAFETWRNRAEKVLAFECSDCNRCILSETCLFDKWKGVFEKCEKFREKYAENYDWLNSNQ